MATDSPIPTVLRSAFFAGLYAAAMVLCIMIGRYGAQVTPIWIPSGILAWALLATPARNWLWMIGLTSVAHLIGGFIVGDQSEIELFYLAANIASPVLLATLLQRKGDRLEFEDRGEVMRFLLYAGLLAPALSLVIALGPSLLSGAFNPRFAAVWFLADSLAFVVFLPIFKILATNGWKQLLTPELRVRAFALLGALVVLHVASIALPAAGYRVFIMLLIPYLIYVAFDVGMTAARAAVALSSVLLLSVALFAPAPIDRVMDPQNYLLAMQGYVLVTVACVMPISAALDERKRLYEAASEALHDAQEAWGALIAAEARFRLVADNTSELMLRLSSDGDIVFASPSWASFVRDPETLVGVNLSSLAMGDERSTASREVSQLVRDGNFDRPRHWQLHLRGMNDDWRLFDVRATLITADEFVAVLRQVQE